MLRTITFGDAQTGLWGACWDLDEGRARFAIVASSTTEAASSLDAPISGSGADSSWTIAGDGLQLEASPEGPPGELGDDLEQLVRVRGRWQDRQLDALGRRGAHAQIGTGGFETVRDVSAWFEPDLALTLVAARKDGAEGHDHDIVSAFVLEEGRATTVVEPRLSTTYSPAGTPARAGLELWLVAPSADEEHGENDDRVERFPRRAAGEALGVSGSAVSGAVSAQAAPLRWHARGREGLGVYVLVRFQAA